MRTLMTIAQTVTLEQALLALILIGVLLWTGYYFLTRSDKETIRHLQDRVAKLESANGSLIESVTLLVVLFVRLSPNDPQAQHVLDKVRENLASSGIHIAAAGDVTIGGDLAARDKIGG